MRAKSILLPIFNYGQAFLSLILISLLALIAVVSDPLLALYMGIAAYIGIVLYSLLRGLAPDEIEISENEISLVSDLLATQSLVCSIGDRVWAPISATSPLFKSDWILINQIERNKFILKARKRDLKIILSEIRPKRPTSLRGSDDNRRI